MITNIGLSNVEIGLVSLLGSFVITVIVLLSILVFIVFRKGAIEPVRELSFSMKRLSTSASMLSGTKSVVHSKNRVVVLTDVDDSKLNYTLMFRTATEKLALRINSIKIGGRTVSTKPYMSDIKELFFRIYLNSNATNSMIISELYDFYLTVSVDELFIFSLMEGQLKSTVITIEVFGLLTDSDDDVLLGWFESKVPCRRTHYPIDDCAVLREVHRPMDIFLNPDGYLCIGLLSICNQIKLSILASTHTGQKLNNEDKEECDIFFDINLKYNSLSTLEQSYQTTRKELASTIIWNEIFLFEVLDNKKNDLVLCVQLWTQAVSGTSATGEPKLMGNINLGTSEECSERSQLHWRYVMDNKNEEASRWHPIRLLE